MATTTGKITERGVNRATLARQMLLERHAMGADEAIGRLVGLQAQAPNPPYVGLWTRLAGFEFAELTRLLHERVVVRSAVMRGTLHLLTADDYLAVRALTQPVLERGLMGAYGRSLAGLDPAEVAELGRTVLSDEAVTLENGRLGDLLAVRWPDRERQALTNAVRARVPLIHVPPAGTWGHHKSAHLRPVETWLGRPLDAGARLDELVLRYLAAFGPATANDMQAWSGLTRLREVTDGLGDRLVRLQDADGRELLDLPDAPRPHDDTPAPARLLPEFDNILIGYADRTRIISDEHRRVVFTKNGQIRATIVVDGVVQGMWKIERARGTATVAVQPFVRLPAATRDALTAEALALLPHTDPTATPAVRFQPPEI
ncbi:MAG TPA: winged helix DNA-binding domain-containing protein [Acidimicrobiales bacterium]|nr:winged helix DNA-binding domain-containing protein [Acidimicrobiales bacterium]